MKRYQIPVIVTVDVEVSDDGSIEFGGTCTDSEGAPWPFSGDATAFDVDDGEWHEQGRFFGDEPWERAANAAYDHVGELLHKQPKRTVVLSMDGGLVTAIGEVEGNHDFVCIDYDVDGIEEDEITRVPQELHGATSEAYVTCGSFDPIADVIAEYVRGLTS